MAKRYYVVQTTNPSIATTRLAVTELMEACFPTVWLATRESYTDRFRRTRTVEASLFPGYLFVEFDMSTDVWKNIPQTRGVRRILGSSPISPTALPFGAVDHLRAEFDAGVFKPKTAPGIAVNDRLILEMGPFAGHAGVCTMSKGERVKVLMNILGDEREIEMWGGLVRRAAE